MHLRNFSRQNTVLFYKLFTRATESGWSMGGCNFRNILPINVPKCYGGKIYVFWQETFKVIKILLPRTWSLPFHYGYCWSHERFFFQERHNHSEKCIKLTVTRRRQKVEIYLTREGSGLAFVSTDLGDVFESNVGNEFEVMLRVKRPHKPEFA